MDKAHIHNHIIWNSTSLNYDRKFRVFLGSGKAVRRLNDTICVQNGYSIVENPKRQGKSYNKWLGGKPPCQRDQLRMAIDAALAQKPAGLDVLWLLLREAGIEVSPRGKSIRLKMPGGKRFIRLDEDSMGTDYSIPSLLAEKKAAYADYRKAWDDMKELLTVRANVQKLMGLEEQEREKEANRQEGER